MAATIKVFLHVDHIHLTNISTFNFNFNAFNAFCNIPYTQPGNDDKAPIHDRNCISEREMVFPAHEANGAKEGEEMIEDKEAREEKREQREKRTKRHGKKRRSRKETAKEEKVEKENKKKQKKKKEEKNKEQKEEEKVKQKKKKDKKKEEEHKRKEEREEQKKKKDEGKKGMKEKREEPEEEGQGRKEEEEHQKKEEEQDEQVKEKEEGKTGETKKNKKKRKVRGKNRVKEQETGETNGNNAKTLSRKDSHHGTKKGSTKEDKLRLPAQPSPSRKFDSDKTEANQPTLAYKQFQGQITTTTEENTDCHSWLTTATKESIKRESFVSSRRIFIASTKDIHVWLTTAQAEHSYNSKKELAIIGKTVEYYKEANSYSSWKEYPPDDPKLTLTQLVCASNRRLPNDVFENAQKDDTLSDLEDILTCNMQCSIAHAV